MDTRIGSGMYGIQGREKERQPYMSELGYFVSAPHVAGMATEDDRVILNPFSSANLGAVYRNELSRLTMRNSMPASFALTPEQESYLNTTTYRDAPESERRATIAARLYSGDDSAGKQTFEQNVFVNRLRELLDGGFNASR